MAFTPEATAPGHQSLLEDTSGTTWTPLYSHSCSFPPEIFREVMLNLIRNPNINSSHLFRADILLDLAPSELSQSVSVQPKIVNFQGYDLERIIVRKLIPRNPKVDKPLDQTCLIYQKLLGLGDPQTLVVYLPHISAPSGSPFYHPAVYGIAFIHNFGAASQGGEISIEYSFFDSLPRNSKLERTAFHILSSVHKHGQGKAAGYVKRVQHDVIIPQAVVQNTYASLKARYAKPMIDAWVETTDPGKHVFEDLGIAAFLIELWKEMYQGKEFPGFVDIGCGNGLLVHILVEEGYTGWGFDARARKSWQIYGTKAKENLHEMVLIPSIIQSESTSGTDHGSDQSLPMKIHNGKFPKGTFIISNHADELTPWTPILATPSSSPFIMIPCCSHSLNGARYRAPPSKAQGASSSAYASLVAWVSSIAQACGWEVEVEMLRIPSTRNTAILGRHRIAGNRNNIDPEAEMKRLVQGYGGADGWEENAMQLVKASSRGH